MTEASVFENLYQEDLYLLPAKSLILLDKDWAECSEDEKTLLHKILGSVKLTFATVYILYKTESDVEELKSYNPSKIISFGTDLASVTEKYVVREVEGIPVICADSLSNLDDIKKKNLWNGLRQMFGV